MLLLIAYFSNYHANEKSDWFCPAQAHQTILRGGGGGGGGGEGGGGAGAWDTLVTAIQYTLNLNPDR